MTVGSLLRWNGSALVEAGEDELEGELLAADSWLVRDGSVRALEVHRARFLAGALSRSGLGEHEISAFWGAAVRRLPREGLWFPRVDVVAREAEPPTLAVRIRPAPALSDTVRLATAVAADPRSVPAVKGPDIAALSLLRDRHARAADGVDELVLLDAAGHVIDGTTTAILWWRGDRLLAPSASLARVASVTARSIRLLAASTGTPIGEEFSAPNDLAGCEVWAVNALHGIRLVTDWRRGPTLETNGRRRALWQRRLDALVRPID